MECARCGKPKVRFERATVLKLPVPSDSEGEYSVTDLYLAACTREERHDFLVECEGEACGERTVHVVQHRIVTLPNVLLVQVRRQRHAGDGVPLRFALSVEDQVSLPGCGTMELLGVVYHVGARVDEGHYTCATRGPDGRFWYFDDMSVRCLGGDIAQFRRKNVVLLAYDL